MGSDQNDSFSLHGKRLRLILRQKRHRRTLISREYVPGDICNYGWAGAEAVRSYALLKSLGISRERYLEFAVRLCDFFVEHYDERDGFGIRWDMQGNRADSGSNTSGGFMIMALIELYRETREKKYPERSIAAEWTRSAPTPGF